MTCQNSVTWRRTRKSRKRRALGGRPGAQSQDLDDQGAALGRASSRFTVTPSPLRGCGAPAWARCGVGHQGTHDKCHPRGRWREGTQQEPVWGAGLGALQPHSAAP